jgi:tripeptidyl-peptidase-2
MEVCLAQFWSSLKSSNVTISIKFSGLSCSASGDVLGGFGNSGGFSDVLNVTSGSNGFTRVDVAAFLRKIEIVPSASLETLRKVIRPNADHFLGPLKSRDILSDSKQIHELQLTYSFKVSNDGTSVTCRFPRVNDVLYESCLDNFCLILYDGNKQVLAYQDIYPKSVKLQEGTYTLKAQVKSSNVDVLEKLANMPLVLDLSLSKSISLPLFNSIGDVISSNGSFKRKSLEKGERTCFFIGDATMPKDAKYGDVLIGKLELLEGVKMDGPLYQLAYAVPVEANSSNESSGDSNNKEEVDLIKEAIRDLEISWIKKLKNEEVKKTLITRLETENPNHIPTHRAHLDAIFKKLEGMDSNTQERVDLARSVIQVADRIIGLISESDLAIHFGLYRDNTTAKEKEHSKLKDQEKDALIYAYTCKSAALKDLLILSEPMELSLMENESFEEFKKSITTLNQWLGEKSFLNARYLIAWTWDQQKKGNYALALKQVSKFLKESRKTVDTEDVKLWKKVHSLKIELYSNLNWSLWSRYEQKWAFTKFPQTFAHF